MRLAACVASGFNPARGGCTTTNRAGLAPFDRAQGTPRYDLRSISFGCAQDVLRQAQEAAQGASSATKGKTEFGQLNGM